MRAIRIQVLGLQRLRDYRVLRLQGRWCRAGVPLKSLNLSPSDARLLRPVSSRTSEMTRRRMQPLNLSSLGEK